MIVKLVGILFEHYHILLAVLAVILYALYKWALGYAIVEMRGDYNQKSKHIGRTLPPFPNGWYVACKSKDLPPSTTRPFDLAGHNIVLARDKQGKVHALHAYCAHMGAHLGIGGQVTSNNCVKCPFHGWMYDLETGQSVDHDKNPLSLKSVQYDQKVGWKQEAKEKVSLRKYHIKEANTFIYVWLHSDPEVKPYYQMIDGKDFCKDYANRGHNLHFINCHLQDIPENGADTFHFRFVHRYLIARFKMLQTTWKPQWKRGDDPDLPEIFEHSSKSFRTFKQKIYNDLVKPLPNKQYYSFGTVDNYVHLPIFGPTFFFNVTIVQMGPSLVNIFFKSHFFEIVFFQYIQPEEKYKQKLVHEMFCTSWIPHWLCYIMLYAEGMQVYYDMLVWDAKRFGNKVYLKDNEADRFIVKWREWFSQHYEGCSSQLQNNSIDF